MRGKEREGERGHNWERSRPRLGTEGDEVGDPEDEVKGIEIGIGIGFSFRRTEGDEVGDPEDDKYGGELLDCGGEGGGRGGGGARKGVGGRREVR